MSLTIAKLVTRCRASPRARLDRTRLDRAARDELPRACARALAAELGARDDVCRIRQLAVRVAVSAADAAGPRLAAAWAEAFRGALRQALARPSGAGPVELVRADSRAAWLARFLTDLLAGVAAQRWEYDEFRGLAERPVAEAARDLLLAEPAQAAAALALLEQTGALERLLALFDELALEQLQQSPAFALPEGGPELRVDDLWLVGRAAVEAGARAGRRLSDRRFALRLFLRLSRQFGPAAPPTPRAVLHLLAALELLGVDGGDAPETASGGAAHPAVVALLAAVRERSRGPGGAEFRARLARLVEEVLAVAPGPPAAPPGTPWVASDVAGLFLLVGLLERLGWPRQIARRWPRAVPFVLAGLALAVIGRRADAPGRLDPGLAMFAGFFDEPDPGGLARFFAGTSEADRAELLRDLCGPAAPADSAATWAATLDALAGELVGAFAGRVRGFGRASRAFAVKQLIALPGRVRAEPERLSAVLAPRPFHVALRVAGLDGSVPAVGWLGGRTLTIELEGL
jgi:hypothetical protein